MFVSKKKYEALLAERDGLVEVNEALHRQLWDEKNLVSSLRSNLAPFNRIRGARGRFVGKPQ